MIGMSRRVSSNDRHARITFRFHFQVALYVLSFANALSISLFVLYQWDHHQKSIGFDLLDRSPSRIGHAGSMVSSSSKSDCSTCGS